MSHFVLDARHLLCPMPVIRAQNRVAELQPGDTLEVHATDPGALHDIPAWCRINGHEVLGTSRAGNEVSIILRVAGA
jgi:tRNA 2-thiouridine synthesizing protein A